MNLASVDSLWVTYILIPFLIFISRIADVSLDTLRIVFITKGNKLIAPILGFFQVLIWLIAITRIMKDLDNISYYLAYAAGFAAGNYVGLLLEEKFALGIQMIRIVTLKDASQLISKLYENGLNSTSIEAEGNQGKVHVIFLIVQRRMISNIVTLTKEYCPNAFYSIEDIRSVDAQSAKINSTQKRYRHLGSME